MTSYNYIISIFLMILGFGVITLFSPILGFSAILLIIFHEAGHCIIALYYKNFGSLGFDGINPSVCMKHAYRTPNERIFITISGLLFSLLVLPINFLMNGSLHELFIILFAAIVCSFGDFLQIISYYKNKRKEKLQCQLRNF